MFAFLSEAKIPVTTNSCPISDLQSSQNSEVVVGVTCEINEKQDLQLNVSFPIFLIAFMSFISWLLFCIFGGIGIPSIPLDLFYDYCTRPKKRTFEQMMEIKDQIVTNAKKVKNIALDCKEMEERGFNKRFFMSSDKRKYNDSMVKLRAATYVLQKDSEMYKIQTQLNDENVCWYYVGLVLGVLFLLISLTWFIHILLYFVIIIHDKPVHPFMNNFLEALVEKGVTFIATIIIFVLSFYMLFAVIKGNLKFGVRIFCFWSIHPMM